ncbi:MAG: divalent-cation tolerance protein CutA [Parcubacteria group bacterium]|nr:divalent-cation tolerance protein CutA [Parcubacteria group bacterium]
MKIVYITCKKQIETSKIIDSLIEKKLAACVNLFSNITSIYRWKGKVVHGFEQIIIAKTSSEKVEELIKKVKSIHSDEIPCIEVIDVENGNKDYIKWVNNELK